MPKLITQTVEAMKRGHRFVTRDVWHIGAPGEAPPSGVIIKQVRAFILLLRGVTEETIMLRASALTFATILFIVPFLAFMFFLIQTFNLGDYAYTNLNEQIEKRIHAAVQLLSEDKEGDAQKNGAEDTQAPPPANKYSGGSAAQDTESDALTLKTRAILYREGSAEELADAILLDVPDSTLKSKLSDRFRLDLLGVLSDGLRQEADSKEKLTESSQAILRRGGRPGEVAEAFLEEVSEKVLKDNPGPRFSEELTNLLSEGRAQAKTPDELAQDAALLLKEKLARTVTDLFMKEKRNAQLARQMLALLFPIFEDEKVFSSGNINPVEALMQQAQDAAQRPGTIGIAGILFVLSTVFGFMRNVEYSFNTIWGVQRTRKITRAVSDYMMITLLLPFGAAMVLGTNAALESDFLKEQFGWAATLLRGGPFLILWLVFTLLYYFVPNTKVSLRYAAMSGLVADGVWSLLSWGLLKFWFNLVRYQFFYSSLALVPLLLLWIYFSWLILLFGALLTFAYQNEATFALERFADKASHAYREALAVRVVVESARRFRKGLGGLSVETAAKAWNVPSRLLNDTLASLTSAGMMTACATEPVTYLPGRSPDIIRVSDVVRVVREAGVDPSHLREDAEYAPLYGGLEQGKAECMRATVAEVAEGLDAREAPASVAPAEPA